MAAILMGCAFVFLFPAVPAHWMFFFPPLFFSSTQFSPNPDCGAMSKRWKTDTFLLNITCIGVEMSSRTKLQHLSLELSFVLACVMVEVIRHK